MDTVYTELSFILQTAVKAGRCVYLHLDPPVWDFTNPKAQADLLICAADDTRARLTITPDYAPFIFSALKNSIFANDRHVLGWDLKPFFSWMKHHLKNIDIPSASYFDLKLLENYAGLRLGKPSIYSEAYARTVAVQKQDNWPQAKFYWKTVLRSLATVVIPDVENNGFLNRDRDARVHPCYEIEAQENGRMSCTAQLQWGVNAHTIDAAAFGDKLTPVGEAEVFLYFDYCNMEVAVLQWLSDDDELGEILQGDADVYEALYSAVMGCTRSAERKFAKNFFLPTMYGISTSGLAQKLNVSEKLAASIINRMALIFEKSFRYVQSFQEDAKSGVVRDKFGRKRFLSESPHKARNFAIQSPATAICLERLVALHRLNVSPILMSIHDGFVVSATAQNVRDVKVAVKECLEAESPLAPGLKMKVACKVGRNFRDMQSL